MSAELPVILYHYKFSPYARRIQWYLALRGISYIECLQPHILPRPDVSDLGLSYRRIPIVSIGRDIYLDTRLQLSKLESCEALGLIAPPLSSSLSSSSRLSSTDQVLITTLLEKWTIDGGLFTTAASLLPSDMPLTSDPKFVKDRAEFFGSGPSGSSKTKAPLATKEDVLRAKSQAAAVRRAEGLNEIKLYFSTLEHLFCDGRDWVLGTEAPSLADLEAVWAPHWLTIGLPAGALNVPGTKDGVAYVTEHDFPRVWAWVRRFDVMVKERTKGASGFKIARVDGKIAREMVVRSKSCEEGNEASITVDKSDALVQALGLNSGDEVEVNPTDTGRNHKDRGRLIAINAEEIVWEATTKEKETVRVHAPRHGFMVRKADGTRGKL